MGILILVLFSTPAWGGDMSLLCEDPIGNPVGEDSWAPLEQGEASLELQIAAEKYSVSVIEQQVFEAGEYAESKYVFSVLKVSDKDSKEPVVQTVTMFEAVDIANGVVCMILD